MVSRSRIGSATSRRQRIDASGRGVWADAATPAETLLRMQRTAGNRATAAAIQRVAVKDTSGKLIEYRFEVGSDIAPALASAAKQAVKSGGLSAKELGKLRGSALGGDESITDNERLFIAALLDPTNAKALNAQTFGPGDSITFPAASVTSAARDQVEAAGRAAMPADAQRLTERGWAALGDLDLAEAGDLWRAADTAAVRGIAKLTGPFAPTAGEALAVATANRLEPDELLAGMLAAASDGTPGDLAMAAIVIAVARAEKHPLLADLLAGNIKVDAVPASAMPGGAGNFAAYSTIAPNDSSAKGDTLYVPNSLSIGNAYHWGAVVHELRHAIDDKAAGGGKVRYTPDRAQGELAAYRAQGASIMRRLAAEPAATRPKMAAEIGAVWTDAVALGMMLETRSDRARMDPFIIEVNDLATGMHLKPKVLSGFLAKTEAKLEELALVLITAMYGIDPAKDTDYRTLDGLAGDSVLDRIGRGDEVVPR